MLHTQAIKRTIFPLTSNEYPDSYMNFTELSHFPGQWERCGYVVNWHWHHSKTDCSRKNTSAVNETWLNTTGPSLARTNRAKTWRTMIELLPDWGEKQPVEHILYTRRDSSVPTFQGDWLLPWRLPAQERLQIIQLLKSGMCAANWILHRFNTDFNVNSF